MIFSLLFYIFFGAQTWTQKILMRHLKDCDKLKWNATLLFMRRSAPFQYLNKNLVKFNNSMNSRNQVRIPIRNERKNNPRKKKKEKERESLQITLELKLTLLLRIFEGRAKIQREKEEKTFFSPRLLWEPEMQRFSIIKFDVRKRANIHKVRWRMRKAARNTSCEVRKIYKIGFKKRMPVPKRKKDEKVTFYHDVNTRSNISILVAKRRERERGKKPQESIHEGESERSLKCIK